MIQNPTKPSASLAATVWTGVMALGAFTFMINLLLLVQPLYMLQVYDRVLVSSSLETLFFISLIACGALILLGFLDGVRGIMTSRLAAQMEVQAGAETLRASINGPKASLGDVQPLRDLAAVRGFISNRGILAYLDLPFAPFFIGILYLIHPHLFWLTVGGAVVLAGLALANQLSTRRASRDPNAAGAGNAMLTAQNLARSSETIQAMGMLENMTREWGADEAASLRIQERIDATNSIYAGISRVLRLGLQIAILGYGGYLVIVGEMTSGMIFASSLISGRGLQPIDQVIAGWKGFVETRRAWGRLKHCLDRSPDERAYTALPTPEGRISLEGVVVYAPNAGPGSEPLLKRISAEIPAGECLAIIGPSGAGKSMLARTIVGAVQPRSGAIRIDGADIRSWDRGVLGRSMGYLSQDVDLLPGTVARNISRFEPGADDAAIIKAAKKAQVHELILNLGNGYDTLIGPAGQQLSGGQRQRIGLARAFYGDPRLLVLDEPNANLDTDGDLALDRAVAQARADGTTVVIVTQRRPIAERADRIMVLRDGAMEDFGPRRDVFERQVSRMKSAQDAAQASNEKPKQQVVSGRFSSVIDGAVGQPS